MDSLWIHIGFIVDSSWFHAGFIDVAAKRLRVDVACKYGPVACGSVKGASKVS